MYTAFSDVYLLYETKHTYYSEGSQNTMMQILKKYVDRTVRVHLRGVRYDLFKVVKDNSLSFLDGVQKGIFTVSGDSFIDFKPVLELLDNIEYQG